MKVKEYFEKNKINKSAFCEKIGISYQYLYQILTGRSIPSYSVAKKISDETSGQVSIEELCLNPQIKRHKSVGSLEKMLKRLQEIEETQIKILSLIEEKFNALKINKQNPKKVETSVNGKSFEGEKEIREYWE